MSGKTREAMVLGLGLWIAGAFIIVSFGGNPLFSVLAIPVALLTAPAMWLATRLHLRDVPGNECSYAGLRLGVIVTAVQCVLDSAGLAAIFRFGYPLLLQPARETLAVALIVAYFWMLVVPWWEGKREWRKAAKDETN